MSASESFQPPPPPPSPQEAPKGPRATKLRPVAIGIFVLGLIFLGAGIPQFIPGGISTGIVMAICAIVLLGLSFIRLPLVLPDEEGALSFIDKVTGVFYDPSRIFRNLRAHPSWVGAFAVIAVLAAVYTFAFVQRITAERIVEHMTQKVAEMGPPFAPPPDRIEKMRNDQLTELKNPGARIGNAIKAAVGIFVLGAFSAALCFVAVLAMGGKLNYWQSLSVVFYAWLPIAAIQKILGLVILYLKSPDDLHPILNSETTLQDNLGLFLSPANHPVLFVLASFIGLTWFWFIWLRAKGLHLAGTKVSSGVGWSVSIGLYVLFMLFVTLWTSLFPGFIS
jgi:Yip1-like protein